MARWKGLRRSFWMNSSQQQRFPVAIWPISFRSGNITIIGIDVMVLTTAKHRWIATQKRLIKPHYGKMLGECTIQQKKGFKSGIIVLICDYGDRRNGAAG